MKTIDIQGVKAISLDLIDAVAAGEEVVITRGGQPMARLSPFKRERSIRFGVLRGKATIADDFDAPLPSAIAALCSGQLP